jgi:3-hydroxyisobutyrate dehydrogenase
MNIGLIGLGNIGVHFGTRLLDAGHDLIVHDRSAPAQERLVAKGAKTATSAKELASRVEIVLLCLPMPRVVADVASEVVQGDKVRIVVDLSTTGPSVTKEVEALLNASNIDLVGAPVSGGTVAAEKGTLAVMPAGPLYAYEEVEPLLRVLGKKEIDV